MHAGAGEVDLCDVIALLNQLMLRFKATLTPLMQELLPELVGQTHAVLGAEWDWSAAAAAPILRGVSDTVARPGAAGLAIKRGTSPRAWPPIYSEWAMSLFRLET